MPAHIQINPRSGTHPLWWTSHFGKYGHAMALLQAERNPAAVSGEDRHCRTCLQYSSAVAG